MFDKFRRVLSEVSVLSTGFHGNGDRSAVRRRAPDSIGGNALNKNKRNSSHSGSDENTPAH